MLQLHPIQNQGLYNLMRESHYKPVTEDISFTYDALAKKNSIDVSFKKQCQLVFENLWSDSRFKFVAGLALAVTGVTIILLECFLVGGSTIPITLKATVGMIIGGLGLMGWSIGDGIKIKNRDLDSICRNKDMLTPNQIPPDSLRRPVVNQNQRDGNAPNRHRRSTTASQSSSRSGSSRHTRQDPIHIGGGTTVDLLRQFKLRTKESDRPVASDDDDDSLIIGTSPQLRTTTTTTTTSSGGSVTRSMTVPDQSVPTKPMPTQLPSPWLSQMLSKNNVTPQTNQQVAALPEIDSQELVNESGTGKNVVGSNIRIE